MGMSSALTRRARLVRTMRLRAPAAVAVAKKKMTWTTGGQEHRSQHHYHILGRILLPLLLRRLLPLRLLRVQLPQQEQTQQQQQQQQMLLPLLLHAPAKVLAGASAAVGAALRSPSRLTWACPRPPSRRARRVCTSQHPWTQSRGGGAGEGMRDGRLQLWLFVFSLLLLIAFVAFQ